MELKSTPWDHQRALVDFMKDRRFGLWRAGCTTGKSFAHLVDLAEKMYQRSLVLTTVAGIDVWINEVAKHTEGVELFAPKKGTTKQKGEAMLDFLSKPRYCDTRLVVLNYESAAMMTEYIQKANFPMAAADESHKLKAHNSSHSKALAMSCYSIPFKKGMTGTAWADSYTALYGQFRWLSPVLSRGRYHSALFGTWTDFFENYVTYKQKGNIKMPTGYKNVDQLKALINPYVYELDTEDVMSLPPERHINVMVPMEGEVKKLYEKMEKDGVAIHLNADGVDEYLLSPNILTKLGRLGQLTSGIYAPYTLDDAGRYVAAGEPKRLIGKGADSKIHALETIIDEAGGLPIVVFCRYDIDVQKIAELCRKMDRTPVFLTGEQKDHIAFQEHKIGDVIIANENAGAEAVTLTRSRLCVFYSISYSRSRYIQMKARVRRHGSDLNYPVTYFHLLMEGSVDLDVRDALEAKRIDDEKLSSGLTHNSKSVQ